MTSPRPPLIIGLGHDLRCDDAVGHLVARRLARDLGDTANIMEATGEGAALMRAWQDSELVIIVDALATGGMPGTIRRMDALVDSIPLEQFFHYSAHNFGLGEAIQLSRALHSLPRQLIIYGIEGRDFCMGERLSPEVEAAIDRVATLIKEELRSPAHHSPANPCAGHAACTGACWKKKAAARLTDFPLVPAAAI